MNIISYNIRGGGNASKRRRVSFLLKSEKVDVCFIQETKLSCFSDILAHSLWGGTDVNWTASNSIGAAGGLVILWKIGSFEVNHNFIGKGFVGININWKGCCINLVNIYAPCCVSARRELWNCILAKSSAASNVEWCLGGDFNEISNREERLGEGGHFNRNNLEVFREFIARMGVVDIPCVGGRFTWFKDNGKAMSRIDRFLVSTNLVDLWGVIDQRIGVRDLSDHGPIRLNCGFIDWGPKPFRFNNAWLKHDVYKEGSNF